MQTPLSNRQPQVFQSAIPSNKKKTLKERLQSVFTTKGLLVLVAVLQIIMILLIINPGALWQQFQNNMLLGEVSSKVSITSQETPIIATVTNADELRNANGAQAQIYKDAQTGDYVIGFSDRLIIYRRSTGEIIYDGVTPSGLVNETQQRITEIVATKAKEAGLIPQNSTEIPQISLITDIETLSKTNPEFYSNANNNDIVGLFAQAQVIVVYNQESDSIINSGRYSTSIQRIE